MADYYIEKGVLIQHGFSWFISEGSEKYKVSSMKNFEDNCISFSTKSLTPIEQANIKSKKNSTLLLNSSNCPSDFNDWLGVIVLICDDPRTAFYQLLISSKGSKFNQFNDLSITEVVIPQCANIAESSIIYAPCNIGRNLQVENFTVIGQPGWSSITENDGNFQQIPHLGGIAIGHNVSIGSFVTIDKGTLDNTEIGSNVRINDRVQIGHNVKIGDSTKISAHTCVSGGTIIGNNCYIGPGVVFTGHNFVCDECVIGAGTIVFEDLTIPGTYVNDNKLKKL